MRDYKVNLVGFVSMDEEELKSVIMYVGIVWFSSMIQTASSKWTDLNRILLGSIILSLIAVFKSYTTISYSHNFLPVYQKSRDTLLFLLNPSPLNSSLGIDF